MIYSLITIIVVVGNYYQQTLLLKLWKTKSVYLACKREGVVLHKVGMHFTAFCLSLINRVRVLNPQWHPCTQTWVKYPSSPLGPLCCAPSKDNFHVIYQYFASNKYFNFFFAFSSLYIFFFSLYIMLDNFFFKNCIT